MNDIEQAVVSTVLSETSGKRHDTIPREQLVASIPEPESKIQSAIAGLKQEHRLVRINQDQYRLIRRQLF
jgi:hypothetical protein